MYVARWRRFDWKMTTVGDERLGGKRIDEKGGILCNKLFYLDDLPPLRRRRTTTPIGARTHGPQSKRSGTGGTNKRWNQQRIWAASCCLLLLLLGLRAGGCATARFSLL